LDGEESNEYGIANEDNEKDDRRMRIRTRSKTQKQNGNSHGWQRWCLLWSNTPSWLWGQYATAQEIAKGVDTTSTLEWKKFLGTLSLLASWGSERIEA
jgi:hypothetical protein